MQQITPTARRNFHGRRHGKALRPAQRRYLAEDLPRLAMQGVSAQDNRARALIEPAALFSGVSDVWLEIGFGAGEHLHALAGEHPEIGFLGAEPFVNGVAALLGRLRAEPRGNIRLHAGDVRDLMDVLPAASLGRAYLLYPDPWPKARHHKRRFVTPGHLVPLARAMRPGAELRLATDIEDYLRQALEELPAAGFEPADPHAPVSLTPWSGWPGTRYEAKALREGRRPHYLIVRNAG